MNKQSLTLFGGALLASTALSTASQAAIVVDAPTATNTTAASTTVAVTAKPLATEVFSATTTNANALKIGSVGTHLMIDFSSNLSSGFNVQLNVVGAAFTGTPSVTPVNQSTSGTVTASLSVTGCSIQLVPDKLLITGCTAQGSGQLSRADALIISGVNFISAGALATAGNSIKLDGVVTNAASSITFENITSVSYVTSKSAVSASVVSNANLTLDNTTTPAFIKFVSPASATATLGSVNFSMTAAVNTTLTNVYTLSASVASTAELKVTHSALSDPALVSITAGGGLTTPLTKTSAQFVSGTVSFLLPGASLNGVDIVVTFDGTSAVSASTGTASATVTPTAPAAALEINRAVAAFSGNIATISRGGMSVELNSLYPTAGQGSTLYRSYLRIANTSPTDGVATITVKNDGTGAAIGSFTTTVTAGATKQVGAADIEAAISTAAATGAMYKVTVSGSFNGYVQHLIWNSVTGLFTDQSGFRNGALTIDP